MYNNQLSADMLSSHDSDCGPHHFILLTVLLDGARSALGIEQFLDLHQQKGETSETFDGLHAHQVHRRAKLIAMFDTAKSVVVLLHTLPFLSVAKLAMHGLGKSCTCLTLAHLKA